MVLLIAFNLVPLAGVLLWGWNVATLLALYWVENGIVGILNVPKILLARGPATPPEGQSPDSPAAGPQAATIPFFLIHYGIFWLVHGFFVFALPQFVGFAGRSAIPVLDASPGFGFPIREPAAAGLAPDMGAVALGAVGLAFSHGASFVMNFLGRREYLRVSPAAQMFAPYRRVMVLHMTIIFGAFISLLLGSPVGAIVVLVLLKTGIDLALHRRAHATR